MFLASLFWLTLGAAFGPVMVHIKWSRAVGLADYYKAMTLHSLLAMRSGSVSSSWQTS